MQTPAGEARANSNRRLHMDVPVLADKQRLAYISSVQTQDAAYRTYQERWMIGMDGKRESGNAVLSAGLNDDDGFILVRVKGNKSPNQNKICFFKLKRKWKNKKNCGLYFLTHCKKQNKKLFHRIRWIKRKKKTLQNNVKISENLYSLNV